MDSRERLLATLDHREPDRVPIDFGGWVTSISVEAYKRLVSHWQMDVEVKVSDTMQQIVKVDKAVLEKLQVDTRHVYLNTALRDWELHTDEHGTTFVDTWKIKWRMPKHSGYYFDMIEHPLAKATKADLDRYDWPDLSEAQNIDRIEAEIEELAKTQYAVVLDGGPGIFEYAQWLRGMAQFLQDMLVRPDFAAKLLDKILEIRIRFNDRLLERVGERIDVFGEGDDLGMQQGPMISPKLYRKLLKPRHRELLNAIRDKTKARVFWHTCGSVYAFIEDMIDIGVDILNPIQVSSSHMNPAELKRLFGERIAFWGGGADSQNTLPFGTPEEIQTEVKQRIEQLAPGGGFVFSPIHNIQRGTPVENVEAMFNTALRFGGYPLAGTGKQTGRLK